ncbi:Rieske 2Fe-2S domain-containing protein [Azospirillum rugosum]|uniref:Nitrite reductase/ring-hydroxylating ferredoxin subunit n=1 Tax=Azospirillum rugosum TaxID=416170 RepID=A0ABS4SWD7_9PROT|nr:Rieske 2Fe-2S domain-containing protein [Azospirillum rugosum]MBP2296787.1 nitrite reductase/ring-hydroxylating ferredoxin subunit [Azospirillum rugosum]MDQ0530390.1 nitrite reductase/ring-hydroxylating ferredoxin subunit [Azospirillum rugosum]
MPWHTASSVEFRSEGSVVGVAITGQDIAVDLLEGAYCATADACTHQHAHMSDGY